MIRQATKDYRSGAEETSIVRQTRMQTTGIETVTAQYLRRILRVESFVVADELAFVIDCDTGITLRIIRLGSM